MLPKHFPHALVILHMFFRNCRLAVKVFTLDIVIGHFGSEVFSRNGKRGQEIKPTATGLIPLVNVLLLARSVFRVYFWYKSGKTRWKNYG